MDATYEIEIEARYLRDQVFGEQSDSNWQATKHNWTRPDSVQWLRQKAKEPLIITDELMRIAAAKKERATK